LSGWDGEDLVNARRIFDEGMTARILKKKENRDQRYSKARNESSEDRKLL
jgi:hypothetical protein